MIYPTFIKETLSLFLLLFLLSQNSFAKVDRFRCMWRDDPATTMVVGWDQISGTDPVFLYDTYDHGGNVEGYLFKQSPDRISQFKGLNNHFVRLTDLQANTVYYFVIVDSQGTSKQFSFKTMPDNQNALLSIIAGGDSRNHREARRSANIIVSKLRPHFVMFGGDMTAQDIDSEWVEWFDDWQATISKTGRITPIVVARGNHEYSNKTLIELFDVKHTNLYYKMSFADDLLQVYTLNSLIATGGDQKNWLEQTLKSNPQAIWKFGQYHYTIRPHTKTKAERNDQYANWATLFTRYGVDVVVESDAHVVKSTYPIRPFTGEGSEEGFIRDDDIGTVYVGEGCWGAPLRKNNDVKSWTRDSGSFNQFKWMLIDKSGINIRTVKTDNGAWVSNSDGDHVFNPPPSLNVWKAPNGEVIYIRKKGPKTNSGIVTSSPSPANPSMTTTETANTSDIATPPAIKDTVEEEIVLPKGKMKVTDFAAALNGPKINITWTTENEMEGMHFEVQRSLDGRTYETIDEVAGSPITGEPTSYLVSDKLDPTTIENGLSYRLKRRLANGDSKVFAPCMVGADLKSWRLYSQISPDESGQLKLKYSLEQAGDVSIRLLSLKKREVWNSILKGQKTGNYLKSIDIKQLPRGSYIALIKAGDTIIRKYKVVKM